jgi:hypothetical protein
MAARPLATTGTLQHAETKATKPEEIAGLTAELLHRGYLKIEPARGRLKLSEQGRERTKRSSKPAAPCSPAPLPTSNHPTTKSPKRCVACRSHSWQTCREQAASHRMNAPAGRIRR